MRRSSTLLCVPVLALVLGVAAACGSGQSSPDIATAGNGAAANPTPSLSHDQMVLNFVKCMREQGIDMPDPQPGPKGLAIPEVSGPDKDDPGFVAAMEKGAVALKACEAHAPSGYYGDGQPTREGLETGLKFAKCMRDRGFDVPDPGAEQDSGRDPRNDSQNQQPDTPQFIAAMGECRQESVR